jgi:DNA-binding MarR family transcriptional regulator
MENSENQTIKKFRELLRRFEREIFVQTNECCCSGITLAQCHALLEIESKEKETLTELANNLGLDKSTVSRTVDGLVNTGLLVRTIPAENRRTSILQLTPAGIDVCHSINGNNDKYIEETLSVLTEQEKEELIKLFEKITSKMVKLRSTGCCSINKE